MIQRWSFLIVIVFVISTASAQVERPRVAERGEAGTCGMTPQRVYAMNQRARTRNVRRPSTSDSIELFSFTPQPDFMGLIVTCGKFRLYYEDSLQAQEGFADPDTGAARRNTLCAVLTYVQNTLDIKVNGTTDFIDLYIAQSWSASNPAPPTVGYLATAGPYFPAAWGTTPGYYAGHVRNHASTGSDPDPSLYDGTIIVNFDKPTYWNNHLDTTSADFCAYDLYSVLLHEVTHTLGFLSSLQWDATNKDAYCAYPNNSFTEYDRQFLYHGDPCAPSTLQKVVINASPKINPAVLSQPDELIGNRVWLRNGPTERNQPVYSGTLDNSYSPLLESLASHLAGTILLYTAMSQFAPGYQPNYVMGPTFNRAQRKREWTLAEIRALMTLGYALNPSFAAAKTLNGADPNGWLLTNNSPAYRMTNCSQPMLAYGSTTFMETLPADFVVTNQNTPSAQTQTQLTINVAALKNIADSQGDAIRVQPDSLFGIRGVSGGGNDHARLSVNASGSTIVYTPEPGYHGRAQFGIYLWDGHERGALRIVSIDVLPGSWIVPAGDPLVVNGNLEDGTEVRQRVLKPNIEHTTVVDFAYEGVAGARHLSGGHPFNFLTNNWNIGGGDIVQNSWYACIMGPHPENGDYGRGSIDWPAGGHPQSVVTGGANERYHPFTGLYNYSTLKNQVQPCRVYRFECDLNFEKTGWSAGQIFTFQLQFVDNPSPSFHKKLYYTVPVNVTISTVAKDTWQHATFTFQYCGTPTYFMNLLTQGVLPVVPDIVSSGTGNVGAHGEESDPLIMTFPTAMPFGSPYIDNLSLIELSPTPPLTLTVTADPPGGACTATPVELKAFPSFVPCNATYVWQPGNVTGNPITVTPTSTTTYTVMATSSACPLTASASATVNAGSGNGIATGWPKHPTGSLRESFNALATLPNGDVIAAGQFAKDQAFPPFSFTSGGWPQIVVYRFSEGCGTVWAVQLGNPNADETVNDVAVDATGNIFLTGSISANTKFGPYTLTGPAVYVLKLDGANGNVIGARASSVNGDAAGMAIAVDSAGMVYVTGYFAGTLKFGAPTLTSNNGSRDIFAARFNKTITIATWSSSFGSPQADAPGGVAVDPGGTLYVAASMGGTFSIGSNTFPNPAGSDVFLGRFVAATGVYLDGRAEGNPTAACTVTDVVADNTAVYFTGSFRTQFNGLTSATTDAYVASWKSGSLANHWIRQVGGSAFQSGASVSLGGGNVYASGMFAATSASLPGFTPPTLSGATATTMNTYVVRVSTNGVPSYAAGTNSSDNTTVARGLAVLPNGTAFVGGYFMGTTSLGAATITANQNMDAYVARLSAAGKFQ